MTHQPLKRLLTLTLGLAILVAIVLIEEDREETRQKPRDREDEPPEPRNIVDTVAAAGSFGTLALGIKTADLVDTLEGSGPFTVFAPTDDAFGQLGETLDELLADKERLANVLRYHITAGRFSAKDLEAVAETESLQGSNLTIDPTEGIKVNGATVIDPDIEASNGMVHGIDVVLMPPDTARKPTAKRTSKKKSTKSK